MFSHHFFHKKVDKIKGISNKILLKFDSPFIINIVIIKLKDKGHVKSEQA